MIGTVITLAIALIALNAVLSLLVSALKATQTRYIRDSEIVARDRLIKTLIPLARKF